MAVASITWTPAPAPALSESGITISGATDIDGNPVSPGSAATRYVEPEQALTVSATATDDDTKTDNGSAPSETLETDGTAVEWTGTHGSLSSTRTLGGASNTWTTPALPSHADIFEAADANDEIAANLTAQPDDDSVVDPGDYIAMGETGNRNDAPGVQVAQAVKVVRKWQFDTDTAMDFLGVTPKTNSKVKPGQTSTVAVFMSDSDGVKATGLARTAFNQEHKLCVGKYRAKVKLTNAKFADGTTEQTFDMSMMLPNVMVAKIPITINPMWDGTTPVKVKVTIMDEKLVNPGLTLAAGAKREDVQDADLAPADIEYIKLTTQCPTSISAAEMVQHHSAPTADTAVYSEQSVPFTAIKYKLGPDLNGGADPDPNYEDITINETFSQYTCTNVDKLWFRQQVIDAFPATHTAEQIVNATLGPLQNTATFSVDGNDQIQDNYAFGVAKNVFTGLCKVDAGPPPSPIAASKTIQVTITQTQSYDCGGGAAIGTRTLTSKASWDIVMGALAWTTSQQIAP